MKVFQSTVRPLIALRTSGCNLPYLDATNKRFMEVGYHACGLAGKQRRRAGSDESTLMDADFVGTTFRPQVEAAKKKLA